MASGETAIGKGDMRSTFENNDFGVVRQPAGTGGSGSSPSDAADNEQFHDRISRNV